MTPASKFWIGIVLIILLILFIKIPEALAVFSSIYTVLYIIWIIPAVIVNPEDIPEDKFITLSPYYLLYLAIKKFNTYLNNKFSK